MSTGDQICEPKWADTDASGERGGVGMIEKAGGCLTRLPSKEGTPCKFLKNLNAKARIWPWRS